MTAEISILLVAIALGATLQVGVGIGFSIVVAPIMMVLLGTATAVPVLLMLNTLVSAVAVDRQVWGREKKLIGNAIIGCLVGIVLGLLVYPFLTEQTVLSFTAIFLLIGVLTSILPTGSNINPTGFKLVSGLAGLATVWAATPGPLMVLGLLATGRTAHQARQLIQPVSLVAYGVALLFMACRIGRLLRPRPDLLRSGWLHFLAAFWVA